jgi:hypothetical protein
VSQCLQQRIGTVEDHLHGEDEGGIVVHFHLQHSSKFDWRILIHKATAFGSTSVRNKKESADNRQGQGDSDIIAEGTQAFQTRGPASKVQ